MKIVKILQWGPKRTVIQVTYSETMETETFLMDNQYLMYLDDMGMVV